MSIPCFGVRERFTIYHLCYHSCRSYASLVPQLCRGQASIMLGRASLMLGYVSLMLGYVSLMSRHASIMFRYVTLVSSYVETCITIASLCGVMSMLCTRMFLAETPKLQRRPHFCPRVTTICIYYGSVCLSMLLAMRGYV